MTETQRLGEKEPADRFTTRVPRQGVLMGGREIDRPPALPFLNRSSVLSV